MTDAQIVELWNATAGSLSLVGTWMQSQYMWQLFGGFIGVLVMLSIIVAIVVRPLNLLGFRVRE